MRYGLMVLWMLLCSVASASVQVSVGIAIPGVSIGINLPAYPELVPVPGYPVYYAPRLEANFFFYDGMYWVYQEDNWYASYWYNGPWEFVTPVYVPLFILRVPVYYYRRPPVYFRAWRPDTPPRWDEHWGHDWEQRRSGWDKWDRRSAPAPAPLPVYQRQYSGDRYPRPEQQPVLHKQHYRYQPRDAVVRQLYQEQQKAPQERGSGRQRDQEQGVQGGPAPLQRGPQGEPRERGSRQQRDQEQGAPAGPRSPSPQWKGEDTQRSAQPAPPPQQRGGPAVQNQRQQPQQGAAPREQQTQGPGIKPQGKGAPQQPKRGKGKWQEEDYESNEGRARERDQ